MFVLELVCVRDRLCERAGDGYSVHVSGSMKARQKEMGELKWSLSNPLSAWEATFGGLELQWVGTFQVAMGSPKSRAPTLVARVNDAGGSWGVATTSCLYTCLPCYGGCPSSPPSLHHHLAGL